MPFGNQVVMEDKDAEVHAKEVMNPIFEAAHEAKLRELLHKTNSIEIKLCSDATKEFIKLLKGDSGGELLRLYVQLSSNFSELLGALKLRQGKPGISYVLKLISAILSHPDGKYKPNDKERIAVSVVLDKLARIFIEEKLEDVYKELTSNEGKRQNAALLLTASIVRRGSGFASDVAKKFDFKLKGFSKLARCKKDKNRKHSTRRAFVGFAMSFLEMAKPGLLRWVLQQREMYSGVLRGLEIDDDETVVYILSTLRDRILSEDSLVPPSLRSVLFGNIVLEQLAGISGRENCESAEIAHYVLHLVCTEPCNGLMPDYKRNPNPLRGNPRRLLDLMKKLKATEIVYHRDLLLAIVKGRLSFCSAFFKEFPYNLEDFKSSSWVSTVSLAANLISSMLAGSPFGFLDSGSDDLSLFDSVDLKNFINIFRSGPLSRSMITKGLQNKDFIVKNATLKLLLEALKLSDSFFKYIICNGNRQSQKLKALMQETHNEIQTLLPDPKTLVNLLYTLKSHVSTGESCLKRKADRENFPPHSMKKKKPVTIATDEEVDIIISGVASDIFLPSDGEKTVDSQTPTSLESAGDLVNVMSELWGDPFSMSVATRKDAELFFCSKVLDTLKIYLITMPTALEAKIDTFMKLYPKPSELPSYLLDSLLALVVEFIKTSPGSGISIKTPPSMYRHLEDFLNLLIFSSVGEVKIQAYRLAQAAMSSTGAFDRNSHEIVAWLSFLPGYNTVNSSVEDHGAEVMQSLLAGVVSFLCDATTTMGNNLFWHCGTFWNYTYHLNEFRDTSPEFSPLVTCVLKKCISLLGSKSRACSLPKKSMVSVYVCNTLKYLLQTQVDASFLAAVISSALSEVLQGCDSAEQPCEWRPLKNLLLFAERMLHEKKSCLFLFEYRDMSVDRSFMGVMSEVRNIVESGHASELDGTAKAFSSAILCTTSDGVVKNFPTILTLSQHIHLPFSFLSFIIYLQPSFLVDVKKLWPTVFFPGLDKASCFVDSQSTDNDAIARETVLSVNFDASESAAADAFSLFLGQAPFHVLFPAILLGYDPYLSEFAKLKDMLMAKLANCTSDFVIPHLRLILFWFYQIHLSYRIEPSAKFVKCAELCSMLANHLLLQLLVYRRSSSDLLANDLIREVVETICCHPVVKASFNCSLDGHDGIRNKDFTDGNFGDNIEDFLSFCQQRVDLVDGYVLDILKSTFDCLFLLDVQHCGPEEDTNKQIVKAFKTLKQGLYMELKDQFNRCIRTDNLLPLLQPFYALHDLVRFISPFELFELANWIFDRVKLNESARQESCWKSALSIGFCIASDAFKMLSIYLEHPVRTRELLNTFWDVEEKDFGVTLIEEMYMKQCKFASTFKLDFAYSCLLEALTAVSRLKSTKCDLLDPLGLVLSRVILLTPMDIVFHCIYGASKIKSEVLFRLVDMSPLHLSVFGYKLSGILRENCHLKRDKLDETFEMSLSNVDYMLLLPAAFSYLNSVFMKLEMPFDELFTKISKFYSELLLRGFCDWKNFASRDLFQNNHDIPSSMEEFVYLLDASNLGKALHMLKFQFALSGYMELDRRLQILRCLLTCSGADDELLDCDVDELGCYPLKQSINLVYRVAAKILLCRMMLFRNDSKILSLPKEKDRISKTTSLKSVSTKGGQSRMHFILSLVKTWQCLVKKYPLDPDASTKKKSHDCLQLYRCLELFILEHIHEFTVEMCDDLIQLQTIPFLEHLVRSSLLYRFEDPKTLKFLRSILTLFLEGKFSYLPFLQLLLAHSQFASTIHSVIDLNSSQTGASFKPMPSILKSVSISHSNMRNEPQTADPLSWHMEILKLLRTLIQSKPDMASSRKDNPVNFRELYFLLLSSYGATVCEIDLEIYSLMSEIESIDRSASDDLVDLDYLWGQAALKIRNERAVDRDASSRIMTNTMAFAEHRRSQFRENLPVDPKICAATVVYYPYDRTVAIEPGAFKDMSLAQSAIVKKVKPYDPVFILRFSIQILLMGYIEPVEFAGMGLLAIAFVSTSSPDVEIRKLAYHFIQKFKESLERCQKKKEIMLLRLLVIYMQNGVEDNWQRFPSIMAVFSAEASLILLDPSNDHYTTLSKHLMHSSMKDIKGILFFRTFFESNSVKSRAETQWMLRLAWAGLNLDNDANLYMKNSILRTVLSLYSTPLADNASKELVLQVVKKSVKLHGITFDLVKKHGVIPWLSSVISNSSRKPDENDKRSSSVLLVLAIEVVVDILQSEEISKWLQHNALEQLTDLASNLYKHFVSGFKSIKDNVEIIDSILKMLIATLKLSQKRMKYEPHFTLSFDGLCQIYKACRDTSSSSPIAKSGLTAILISSPPIDIFYENPEKLSGFLMWAVSVSLKSDYAKSFPMKNEVPSDDESMISKLLRWLVSVVLLSKLYWKLNDAHTTCSKTSNPRTLQAFLEYVDIGSGGSKSSISDCADVLAMAIVFLQQQLGSNLKTVSSVVSALNILLFGCTSKYSDLLNRYGSDVVALQSRIRCPTEANPEWRWSFEKAWRDVEIERSEKEKMDEYHACQSLMLIISNILNHKPFDSPVLSHWDELVSNAFEWERTSL